VLLLNRDVPSAGRWALPIPHRASQLGGQVFEIHHPTMGREFLGLMIAGKTPLAIPTHEESRSGKVPLHARDEPGMVIITWGRVGPWGSNSVNPKRFPRR